MTYNVRFGYITSILTGKKPDKHLKDNIKMSFYYPLNILYSADDVMYNVLNLCAGICLLGTLTRGNQQHNPQVNTQRYSLPRITLSQEWLLKVNI